MSKNVFISYTHVEPDTTLAVKMQKAFEFQGYEVYIDIKNKPNENWVKQLDDALDKCDIFLLLLSEKSSHSAFVLAEVKTAKHLASMQNGKPRIVPIRIGVPFDEPISNLEMNILTGSIQQAYWDGKENPDNLIQNIIKGIIKGTSIGKIPYTKRTSEIENLHTLHGAIQINDNYYIYREADKEVMNLVKHEGAFINIIGPRQTGKTSLIMRIIIRVQKEGMKVAYINFQTFSSNHLCSLNNLCKSIAEHIERDLRLPKFVKEKWDNDEDDPIFNFEDFAEFTNLGNSNVPIIICMDVTDSFFDTSLASDFFSILRSIHITPVFNKLRWLVARSTKPMFFIEGLNESPFNIGYNIELLDFNEQEVFNLSTKYQCKLDHNSILSLYELLNGHPYLTQLALYTIRTCNMDLSQIINNAINENSIFREHLRHLHLLLFKNKKLVQYFYSILNGVQPEDLSSIFKLKALGLIHATNFGWVVRCKLYEKYFRKQLKI